MLGRALGAGPIIATDITAKRRQIAEDLGLVNHTLPADAPAAAEIYELTAGRGCTASIDCSGNGAARAFATPCIHEHACLTGMILSWDARLPGRLM
jgi:threonine dehydrogenase-like Zn-dependent dehydrogenase